MGNGYFVASLIFDSAALLFERSFDCFDSAEFFGINWLFSDATHQILAAYLNVDMLEMRVKCRTEYYLHNTTKYSLLRKQALEMEI